MKRLLLLATTAWWSATTAAAAADSFDWLNWRGPEQNNSSRETNLVDTLDVSGGAKSKLLWKKPELATRSTPVIMDGRLYVICRADARTEVEAEQVICADTATGDILWRKKFNVYLSDVPGERVGWSSCVCDPETGYVYAQGVCGLFLCLDAKTGKTIWQKSMHERYGLLSTYGGRTNVPVIFEDMVLISAVVIGWGDMAKPTHQFWAMDKRTGEVLWFRGTTPLPYDTTYSTPVLTVFNGQAAMVFGSGDGAIWAFQPRTGREIWQFKFSRRGINTSPLVVDDRVYVGHSEENIGDEVRMGAIAAIDGELSGNITNRGKIWQRVEVMAGKASPVMVDGKLWFVDDRAKLWIVDPENGKPMRLPGSVSKLGTSHRGTPLVADSKVYIVTNSGTWRVLRPDKRRGARLISKGRLPSGEECHASPIVSAGRIYVATLGHLYCFGEKDSQASARPAAGERAKEAPVGEDQKIAHVQLTPAEVLLRPGEERRFSVRLYNARGQRIEQEVKPKFSVDGPGEFKSDGAFVASSDAAHVAAIVGVEVEGRRGTARVRIVPDLPWKFDFSDGQIPITWVGARYRHIVRKLDGNDVMVKVTTIPKGTRSQAWMGHPDLSNYTIQADVLGRSRNGKMPNIGLIAQRYICDLQGAHQKLQIRSWGTQLRMAQQTPFSWKADQWHTIKFEASERATESGDGKIAVLRVKVWPKDQQEPDEWTLEATDKSPNLEGSPGLFGDATDAEILLDNILVTPNASSGATGS